MKIKNLNVLQLIIYSLLLTISILSFHSLLQLSSIRNKLSNEQILFQPFKLILKV